MSLIFLSFIYCSSLQVVNYTYHHKGKNYSLQKTTIAHPGDIIIKIEDLSGKKIFSPLFKHTPLHSGYFPAGFEIKPKQKWTAIYKDAKIGGYLLKYNGINWLFHIKKNGSCGNGWVYFNGEVLDDNFNDKYKWEFVDILIDTDNSTKTMSQELLYSGIANDIIKIQYREFINNLARPAFYQNLEYDLSISKIIRWKNLTIKVIEANNEHLKYQILSD